MRVFHETVLSSTNTVLGERVASRRYRRLPVALTADLQTGGRGLGRNVWCSDKGANALFSMAFQPSFLRAEHQFLLNMALSLSMLYTLDEWGAAHGDALFRLKWPNDLYAGEYKVGGILFELSVMGDCCARAVMGVGINVNQRDFPDCIPNPLALHALLPDAAGIGDIDMPALRLRFIARAARAARRLERQMRHRPVEAVLRRYKAAYQKRLLFFGQERTYVCQGERMRAVLYGVDDFGQAQVRAVDGRRFSCGLKELQYVFGN